MSATSDETGWPSRLHHPFGYSLLLFLSKPFTSDSTLPFLFCHLSLLVEPSSAPRSTGGVGPGSAERADLVAYRPSSEFDDSSNPSSLYTQSLRLLYGTLVSSPHQLPMSTMERKVTSHTLFVFPDVSIRARGRYRLRVGLMRIAA